MMKWDEYSIWIIETMKELKAEVRMNRDEIVKLKIKAGIWGATGAGVVSLVAYLAK